MNLANIISQLNIDNNSNFVYKLDPRTKFLFTFVYTVLLMIMKELLIQIFILISLIPILIAGKLVKSILKSIYAMSFIFFFIILLNTLVISFNFALIICIRFLNIIIVFSILFRTTNPDDLTQALAKMGIPFSLSFGISLAFRFVPTLAKEVEFILESQKSRGYDIKVKGLISQIKNIFPIIIPLIFNAYQRAYYVAESLETRSFGVKNIKRTYLYPIKMKNWDYFMVVIYLLIFISGLLIHFQILESPTWLYYQIPF